MKSCLISCVSASVSSSAFPSRAALAASALWRCGRQRTKQLASLVHYSRQLASDIQVLLCKYIVVYNIKQKCYKFFYKKASTDTLPAPVSPHSRPQIWRRGGARDAAPDLRPPWRHPVRRPRFVLCSFVVDFLLLPVLRLSRGRGECQGQRRQEQGGEDCARGRLGGQLLLLLLLL